jgi:hypothetical protein
MHAVRDACVCCMTIPPTTAGSSSEPTGSFLPSVRTPQRTRELAQLRAREQAYDREVQRAKEDADWAKAEAESQVCMCVFVCVCECVSVYVCVYVCVSIKYH